MTDHFKNIFLTGSIAYDTIMDFPGEFRDYLNPEKLHQINVSFAVEKLEKQLGGNATNIAYNIAIIFNSKFSISKIYKPKINVIGSVGKDGNEFLKFFRKNGIQTEGMMVDKRLYTSSGSVITDKNDNQIWGFYYGAAENVPMVDFNRFQSRSDLFIISPNHKNSFLYFQNNVIKYKIPYLYDPGMALTWITDRQLEQGVMNSTYIVANDYEIAMITKRLKKTVNELTSYGLKIITTFGGKGVSYQDSKIIIKIPAFKIEKIVDPTGAGDAWRGGFVAGLVMGYSTRECLKLGNIMASFAIEKYGTVNHKPNRKEIEKRLKSF